MIREYDTYIFDLDGTLLDTLTDLAASCNYALQQHGMAQRTIDEVRMFVGNGVKKLMERAIPDGLANPQFDEVYQCFRQHYLKHGLDHTAPYPGVLPMLAELKRRNKKIAVVSNKFYRATEELCKHFFDQYVEVAIGEREGIKKKPAPDTVLEALAQLSVTGDNAVYIGDSQELPIAVHQRALGISRQGFPTRFGCNHAYQCTRRVVGVVAYRFLGEC